MVNMKNYHVSSFFKQAGNRGEDRVINADGFEEYWVQQSELTKTTNNFEFHPLV